MTTNVLAIGLSGLLGASNALTMAASNTVNARSGADLPQAGKPYAGYVPVEPAAHSLAGGGVFVGWRPTTPSYVPSLEADGSVKAMPNVDPTTEQMTMMTAEIAYKASAALIRTDARMSERLLDAIG